VPPYRVTAVVLAQSESRVEHAVRREHENASERGIRGGLRATARPTAPLRCRSSLDALRRTRTAARATEYRGGDAFSGVRNPALDLRQRN